MCRKKIYIKYENNFINFYQLCVCISKYFEFAKFVETTDEVLEYADEVYILDMLKQEFGQRLGCKADYMVIDLSYEDHYGVDANGLCSCKSTCQNKAPFIRCAHEEKMPRYLSYMKGDRQPGEPIERQDIAKTNQDGQFLAYFDKDGSCRCKCVTFAIAIPNTVTIAPNCLELDKCFKLPDESEEIEGSSYSNGFDAPVEDDVGGYIVH